MEQARAVRRHPPRQWSRSRRRPRRAREARRLSTSASSRSVSSSGRETASTAARWRRYSTTRSTRCSSFAGRTSTARWRRGSTAAGPLPTASRASSSSIPRRGAGRPYELGGPGPRCRGRPRRRRQLDPAAAGLLDLGQQLRSGPPLVRDVEAQPPIPPLPDEDHGMAPVTQLRAIERPRPASARRPSSNKISRRRMLCAAIDIGSNTTRVLVAEPRRASSAR